MGAAPKVSILMLTHNAPRYVELAVRSVRRRTHGVDYELVVVDNASDEPTRSLVEKLYDEGLIDTLHLSPTNTLFAEGNNIAAGLADPDATHFLLLNSDIRVIRSGWLAHLLAVHGRGATSYGIVPDPPVADGYCLLVDADLYRAHPLDADAHQWTWAVTRQQAQLLRDGHVVQGYASHWSWLHHFGGKSGVMYLDARGLDVDRAEVESWFDGHEIEVLDAGPDGTLPGRRRILPGRLSRQATRARNLLLRTLPA